MRAGCGRADLVRALASHGEAGMLATARLLGLAQRPTTQPAESPAAASEPGAAVSALALDLSALVQARPPLNRLPFWICTGFEDLSQGPAQTGPQPLAAADLEPAPGSLPSPPPPDLEAWPGLWRWLRSVLINREARGEIDTDRLVDLLCRAERLPRRLPRRRVRRLPSRLLLVKDRSPRLGQFDLDQARLAGRLERVMGKSRMTVVSDGSMPPIDPGREFRQLPRGSPVLALTDLGAYAEDAIVRDWNDFGSALVERGLVPLALVPVPRVRWGTAGRRWRARVWDRLQATDREPLGEDAIRERADRLLRLVSPAMRFEPGLLRAARRLLPPDVADVGTEVDVWNHPAVTSYNAGFIDRALASQLRATWAAESAEIRAAFVALLRAWHAGASPYVVHEETATLVALDPSLVTDAEVAAAKSFLPRLAAGGRYDAWLPDYVDRQLQAAPPQLRSGHGELVQIYRQLRRARRGQPPVPPAVDPSIGARLFEISQGPAGLEPRPFDPTAVVTTPGPGSPVALAHCVQPAIHVDSEASEPRAISIEPSASDRIPLAGPLAIETDLDSLVIERIVRPEWAVAIGRDRFGLWAEVELGDARVPMRLRYIPPGRFQMGSPPGEAGRDNTLYPEPQHEVTITRGYWLGETAVSQAQWHAVMATSPSRFHAPDGSPKRPVEQVSWDDARDFLGRAGLGLRLPTEAEWERACRAGTTTATYAGDLVIRGENDAPVLDAIAWYGGNSGKDFDLENGYDSSDWPNKQHPHQKAGTRNVGEKLANGFGLRDMLGNVWEWCEDWMGEYRGGRVEDPAGPTEGSLRVLRGGSWSYRARLVRAAYRFAYAPGDRYAHFGFRCARGQEPAGGAAEPRSWAAEPPGERRSRSKEGQVGAGRAARPEAGGSQS